MKNLLRPALVVTGLFLGIQSFSFADQADLDQEITNYVAVISGSDFEAAKSVMETLRWSGISDARVYDLIEDKLAEVKNSSEKNDIKKAAWYAKALGFSGDEKYAQVLKSVLYGEPHKSVEKYANLGLQKIASHRSWNTIISKGTITAPSGKLEQTRVENMLQADDYELMRLGAKRVANSFKGDEAIIGIAANRLSKEWVTLDKNNGVQLDGVAWLLKAVGTSRSYAHKPLIDEIAATTKLKKIKKYAKKAQKSMKN